MTPKSTLVFRWALIFSAILITLLLASFLFKTIPNSSLIFAVIIVLFQILSPIEILRYLKIPSREFNIYAHNIDTALDFFLPPYGVKKVHPHYAAIVKELSELAKFSLMVLIPYVVLYWLFFKMLALRDDLQLVISINFPPQFFYEFMTQIFVVALPEELFYRGFLQTAFLHKWPNKTHIFGLPMGRAIIVTNMIFALAHVASTFSLVRLLTFFPGLAFSYLIYKNKSLLSPILFHALCNILGQILYASIYLR